MRPSQPNGTTRCFRAAVFIASLHELYGNEHCLRLRTYARLTMPVIELLHYKAGRAPGTHSHPLLPFTCTPILTHIIIMAVFTRLLSLAALAAVATAYSCAECPATIPGTPTYYNTQQSPSLGAPTYCGYAAVPYFAHSQAVVTDSADDRQV